MDHDDYIYHVTYYNHLGSIEAEGLDPERAGSIGGVGLEGHKEGKVFFTEASGLNYWLSKSIDWAFHNYDDPMEQGWIPLILRFQIPHDFDENDSWIVDSVGTDDAGHCAYMAELSIPSEMLEIYYNGKWIPVDAWRGMDESSSYDDDGYPVDDDENPFYWVP